MSATTGREAAELLIRKAAVTANDITRPHGWDTKPRTHGAVKAEAAFDAYSTVAADVLGICSTPFAFRLAVIEAVRAVGPYDGGGARTREASVAAREAWHGAVLAHTLAGLG